MSLRTKIQSVSLLTDIILCPDSYNESWTDIVVITLYQHARDQATEEILTYTPFIHAGLKDEVQALVQTEQYNKQQEFIDIRSDKIVIGLFRDTITETDIDDALHRLMELKSLAIMMHKSDTIHTLVFN